MTGPKGQSQHEDEESLRNLMPPPDGASNIVKNNSSSNGTGSGSQPDTSADGCRNQS